MTTAEPPSPAPRSVPSAPEELPRAGAEEALAPPAVVAVVVTRNPGPFLEQALASLTAQDYPDLTVLVVDSGSSEDLTDRVAAVAPEAYVRRLDTAAGFGGAANAAIDVIEGATFVLLCHDDVALDPNAVRLLVEEAFRSNAAICGPKLVAADRPEVLLDVGRALDHFGGAHTGIEPGEIDQEQHDGVRDVFYVSSAVMLVRTDLYRELGGFDPDTFPGSEDLDLCWRARLAGARVMVVPDARARHAEAATARAPGDAPRRREIARRRVRVLLTCYSAPTLAWVVPLGLLLSALEAVVFAFTRRRADALAEARAWWWNLVHVGRLRAARRRAQSVRTINDRDLHELTIGWTGRVNSFLTHHHADERMESIADSMRATFDRVVDTLRHPGSLSLAAFVVLVLFGSRELVTNGVPSVGQLVRWNDVGTMLSTYGSAWRYTGLGSASAAPPGLLGMAGLGAISLGAVGFARTILVVGCFVVAALGTLRLARRLGGSHGAAVTAALLYGVNPVPRNALANGRFGPLVLYAVAPFLVLVLVRAAGYALEGRAAPRAGRTWLALAVLTALATAFYPPAALALVVVAVSFLVGSVLAGRSIPAAVRGLPAAVVGCMLAAALLFPWTLNLADARSDPGAFGFAFHPRLGLEQVLRFQTGPAGAGVAGWGLFVAAAFALLVASGSRFAWAARAWVLAVAGFALAYLPSRLAPHVAVPAPEAALSLAALGLALAAGLGLGTVGDELRRARFGWRQLALVLAGAGVVLSGLGFAADSVGGRWHAAESGWNETLAFARDQLSEGRYRILWIGDAAALPVDPFAVDERVSYSVTMDDSGTATELGRAPVHDADRVLARAVRLALDGRTTRLGRLVAPMGVRYVAVPIRNGPEGERFLPPTGLRARLADQLDLAHLQSPDGLVLYENTAWIPVRAVVPSADDVPEGDVGPIPSALRTNLAGAARPLTDRPVRPGTVVLGEAYDADWAAVSGRTLRHTRAFGWANAFAVPDRGTVSLSFRGQATFDALLVAQAFVWLVVLVAWWRTRRRPSRSGRALNAARRADRRRRDGERRPFLDSGVGADAEDGFWVRT